MNWKIMDLESQITHSNEVFYDWLLEDINRARKSICLETFTYSDDEIGRRIRDALVQKAGQGVKVCVSLKNC